MRIKPHYLRMGRSGNAGLSYGGSISLTGLKLQENLVCLLHLEITVWI